MEYLNFDAQLRASPVISEIVDRLVRYETVTREIQRDLGDVHRKINVLLERSLANRAPEFKDPFAPGSMANTSMNGSRASVALAPHQLPNHMPHQTGPNQQNPGDDVGQISQRLNALTSSVGQLLALQTQQIQASNAGLSNNQGIGGGITPQDISPNQALPHNPNVMLGHGLPSGRSDMRGSPRPPPTQPARTWSAGSLDLPPRTPDSLGSMRQDALFRDKRRSTMTIPRRDSAGVCSPFLYRRCIS